MTENNNLKNPIPKASLVGRLVMLPIGDIIKPLNLSDEDKKELVDNMCVAMKTTALKLMVDTITNGQGFEKPTSFPKRKFLGGDFFNMFTA